jgi:hypothetical protein
MLALAAGLFGQVVVDAVAVGQQACPLSKESRRSLKESVTPPRCQQRLPALWPARTTPAS